MSRQHQFPPQPAPRQFKLREFLGVDFTTHESEVNTRRSPDAVNLVSGSLGSMDKRFGAKIEHNFGERIWCSHNNFYSFGSVNFNIIFIQSGKKIYYKVDNGEWTTLKLFRLSLPINDLELQEQETNIVNILNKNKLATHYYKLIQGNWITNKNDLIIIFMYHDTVNNTLTPIAYNLYDEPNGLLSSIETQIKYPKTSIGRTPNGLTSTPFEERNVLTSIRKNSFLSNVTDTQFIMDSTLGYVLTVEQMQSNGTFSTSLHDVSNNTITYTVDTANKKITFSAVPHATYKTGEDNIIVTFSSASTFATSFSGSEINNYRSSALFGLNGEDDYLFLCNRLENHYQQWERWGNIRSPLYFAENNYAALGTTRKIGYSRYGQSLIVHSEHFLDEPTMYLKTASLDDAGETIFKNTPTESSVGAIARNSFATLRNDPLWLSEFGINALVTEAITSQRAAQDRGFYVNKLLLEESNLDKAYAFIFDNKYFICVNSNVYIADVRNKYTERLAQTEQYQYDWYYWERLDIQNHFIYNNELYFGTTNGLLMKYKNESDSRPYQDEITGTDSAWLDATSYSKGNIVSYLTKYYICLKSHTSDSVMRNPLNSYYWNEIEKGTGVYYVPVLAYWTTPIMNMGDMTSLKTLKNLWVRLGKYAHMSARIYYSTQGVILEKYDGIFDFSDIDFSRFTFSTDTDPSVLVANRQQRKFNSIQFKVESRDANPFSLLEIVGEFIFNGKFKG